MGYTCALSMMQRATSSRCYPTKNAAKYSPAPTIRWISQSSRRLSTWHRSGTIDVRGLMRYSVEASPQLRLMQNSKIGSAALDRYFASAVESLAFKRTVP